MGSIDTGRDIARDSENMLRMNAKSLLRRQRIVLGSVSQERDDVADRCKADTHHDRVARPVDELVDRATVSRTRLLQVRFGRPGRALNGASYC